MQQQKVRRHRTAREWEAVFAAQASSGLSLKTYCQRHGVTLSVFYNARSRVKSKAKSLAPSPDAPAEFIGISLDAMLAPAPPQWDVELSLGEGLVLRIRRSAGKN